MKKFLKQFSRLLMKKVCYRFGLCVTSLWLLSPNTYAQWTKINSFSGWSVSAFVVSGTNIFAGTDYHGIYLSTNNGTSWNAVNNGLEEGTSINTLVISGSNIFAGAASRGVFLSTNNGTSWSAVNNGITNRYISSLVVSGRDLIAGCWGDGVYLSTNNGLSWTPTGLVSTPSNRYYIRCLLISGSNLYAGTEGDGVFLSTNNGTSWNAVNYGLTSGSTNSLVILGTNLLAATGNGIFLTTNNGISWRGINTSQTETNIYSLAVSGTNLFAAAGNTVFLTTNNGVSWSEVNNGLTGTYVISLAISGTNLFVGTYNDGVWRRSLSEMITSVEKIHSIPSYFSLQQNFPNPFNPYTTMQFSIPHSQFVTLKVYDMLGREVTTLVNEEKLPGNYEVKFDGSNLPSGTYFYRLQAGSFSQTKKLLLLK